MRIRDWKISFGILLILVGLESWLLAGSTNTTPLFHHTDTKVQREFQNVYQTTARAPAIFIGSGVPNFTPQKIGDIFIDTTTPHTYVSTATVTKLSWFQTK